MSRNQVLHQTEENCYNVVTIRSDSAPHKSTSYFYDEDLTRTLNSVHIQPSNIPVPRERRTNKTDLIASNVFAHTHGPL